MERARHSRQRDCTRLARRYPAGHVGAYPASASGGVSGGGRSRRFPAEHAGGLHDWKRDHSRRRPKYPCRTGSFAKDAVVSLTLSEQAMKDEFIRARGYWRPWTEGLLRLNPAFLQAYARYAGYPAAAGPLSKKMCELIYVALDGSATHLFRSGLALHMKLALESGASAQEIIEVLQLATAQGLDGCNLGVEILVEELAAAGRDTVLQQAELSVEQEKLRADYLARFGDWPDFCDHLLR